MNPKIEVTKPFLPPQSEYLNLLREVWERQWLTNDGPILRDFERELSNYLGLSGFQFVSNGTIALQLAIRALNLEGEVITTPFSFVATAAAIVWENCTPVFVDINPLTFNIDPSKIEEAITPKTKAILTTHAFGNPCDIERLIEIANKYQLKIIFDAAHCFGTKYNGQSVLNFGDISTISFHATKLFHTVEGGGLVAQSLDVNQKISLLKNFGHDGPGNINGLGINAKNSEFHAAMGLVNLKYGNQILQSRKSSHEIYDKYLDLENLNKQDIHPKALYNYSYYPIVFENQQSCLRALEDLQSKNIFPRRYFMPALNLLNYVEKQKMKNAEAISEKILCLPLYHEISEEVIVTIAESINRSIK